MTNKETVIIILNAYIRIFYDICRSGGTVGVRVNPTSERLGSLNPSRYRPKSFKQVVTDILPITLQVWVSRVLGDYINGCPVSQYLWHAKEPSLLNAYMCRAYVNIFRSPPVMVMFPYEWKILEWDENPKQTNVRCLTQSGRNIINLTKTVTYSNSLQTRYSYHTK